MTSTSQPLPTTSSDQEQAMSDEGHTIVRNGGRFHVFIYTGFHPVAIGWKHREGNPLCQEPDDEKRSKF